MLIKDEPYHFIRFLCIFTLIEYFPCVILPTGADVELRRPQRLENVRAHQLSSISGYMGVTIKNVTNLARVGRMTCRVQA